MASVKLNNYCMFGIIAEEHQDKFPIQPEPLFKDTSYYLDVKPEF